MDRALQWKSDPAFVIVMALESFHFTSKTVSEDADYSKFYGASIRGRKRIVSISH